jgi:RimJ/RimL family protein N-acetyltransferase
MTDIRPNTLRQADFVPRIATSRLILRGHQLTDFAACAAMWADPLVVQHIGGRPSTTEEVWARLLRYVGHWALLGFGYWVVEERTTGRFVGEVGFADFHREMDPPLANTPESGWALASWAHGQGFATEAVRAALAWGDNHFAGSRTVCLINTDNLASMRVAEKCGYQEFARTTYKGTPVVLFQR